MPIPPPLPLRPSDLLRSGPRRVRTVLFGAALATLVACGPPDPFGGNRVDRPDNVELGGVCEEGGTPTLLAHEGVLEGADYWNCAMPEPATTAPRFDSFAGLTVGVNGGSLALQLFPDDVEDLQDREVYVGLRGRRGLHLTDVEVQEDGRVLFDVHFRTDAAEGNYTLLVAIDDGGTPDDPRIGEWLEIPVTVIAVAPGGADVQVTVNWMNRPANNVYTDVDLHVIDPNGDRVAYFNTTVPSGGILDLDSNPACSAGDFNENIYWPVGTAPSGTYRIQLAYWSACEFTGEVAYRVTILVDGSLLRVLDGVLTAADEGGDSNYIDIYNFGYE
jgi:hypothetical protein